MSSATERIAAAFSAAINRLQLNPSPTAVRHRKQPLYLDGETCPLIFISVGDEEDFEPIATGSAKGLLLWGIKRRVSVTLVFDQQGKAADNLDLRNWRDSLWPAFVDSAFRTVLPELNDITPGGRPLFDAAAFSGGAYDWSVLTFTVETLEERAN